MTGDVERLHQVLTLQPRLLDQRAPFKAQRGLLHRHVIDDALTWLEIHGERPDLIDPTTKLPRQRLHDARAKADPRGRIGQMCADPDAIVGD